MSVINDQPMKIGTRLRSATSTAEVIIVRAPNSAAALTCGGVAMVGVGAPDAVVERAAGAAQPAESAQLGKRYLDPSSGLQVLCTKGGGGRLEFDGRPLELQAAQPLPASD